MEILQSIKNRIIYKFSRGTCTTCKRNKSLFVSDQTINGEGLGDFLKYNGKAAKAGAKNIGKKIHNIPARPLEVAANIGTAAASKNPKLIAATALEAFNFVHQGKGLYLGKIHLIYLIIVFNS